MRALAVAVAATSLVAGSCGGAGGNDDSAVDRFCAGFADYRGAEEALATIPVPDPRRLLARLGNVEAPPELADAWQEWQDRERLSIAADVVRGAHGRRPFWIVTPPEERAPSPVDAFWEQECVAVRGYQVPVLVSALDPDLPPHSQAPDGGEIRVVEHGFTAAAGTDSGDEIHVVSYGIVVENTSDHVATGTSVRVRMLDEDGRPVGPRSGIGDAEHTIPVLLPGQRFGLGEPRWVKRSGTVELVVIVGESAGWWPVDHDLVAFPGITTGDVEVDPYYGGALYVRFRIDSAYRVRFGGLTSSLLYEPARTPYVLFRNSDGEIVGGGDYRDPWDVPPGHSEGGFVTNEIPILELESNVAPARTRVYF
jgi:hypothetical protein